MKFIYLFLLVVTCPWLLQSQEVVKTSDYLLSSADMDFLEKLASDIVEGARIYPGQSIVDHFGPNNTGGVLIQPGASASYPSFWIRDYAMSLESGLMAEEEQKHMLLLTAAKQADQTWITKNGSMVPLGSIADHIRIDDGLPIYFPGTYDYIEQGNRKFGLFPPYGDQFFFVNMAYHYVESSGDHDILMEEVEGMRLIDRLILAFHLPPSRLDNHLVVTTEEFRGVDFGFRDVITITGDLSFPSLLKYQAALDLAQLCDAISWREKAVKYRAIADKIKAAVPSVFMDDRGMIRASTGKSNQADVWSTVLAIYLNVLDGELADKTSAFLAESYRNGHLAYKGHIRHVLTTDDYSEDSAWEISMAAKNTYQNGAYWATPTGWTCVAIARTDLSMAKQLASDYITELRANDYRKNQDQAAPYECIHPSGYRQNQKYMTSVTCPLAAFKRGIKVTSK